jgi:SNF2 family DNA or RNA helicase
VYYSQSYHLGHRLQSEDRCHRAGSERHEKVTYVDVVCRGTVDEIIAAALAGKKGMAEVVVDLREHLAAVAS